MSAWTRLLSEQRAHQRVVPLPSAPVEVQIMGGTFLEVLRARDLSAGGVGVHVPHAFEGYDLADEVELVLKLPKQRPFLAKGTIKRFDRERTSFAVQFTSVGDLARRQLEAYVSELAARGRGI